jgi:hypothetical protein
MLRSENIEVSIWCMPVEVPNPIPFDQDHQHRSYDSNRLCQRQKQTFWLCFTPVMAQWRHLPEP